MRISTHYQKCHENRLGEVNRLQVKEFEAGGILTA
jgi:hypothetical protein